MIGMKLEELDETGFEYEQADLTTGVMLYSNGEVWAVTRNGVVVCLTADDQEALLYYRDLKTEIRTQWDRGR